MKERSFAAWVEPIAGELRKGRHDIAGLARELPATLWDRTSPNPGWTNKDLVAHLAVGDWICQMVLRAVVHKEPLDLPSFREMNERNVQLVDARKGYTIEELVLEVIEEGEETQELLSRLSDENEHLRQKNTPVSLGEYLRRFPSHDREHLAELQEAAE